MCFVVRSFSRDGKHEYRDMERKSRYPRSERSRRNYDDDRSYASSDYLSSSG